MGLVWFIVYIKRSPLECPNKDALRSLKIILSMQTVHPSEMLCFATFYAGFAVCQSIRLGVSSTQRVESDIYLETFTIDPCMPDAIIFFAVACMTLIGAIR